jgi:hypothetical protein
MIKKGNDDVYIKSFTTKNGISTFMSVEKDKRDGRFIITNYRRHKNEIIRKIKWADGILYIKEDSGSPASMDKEGIPHADSSHTSSLSPDSPKKSSKNIENIEDIRENYQAAHTVSGNPTIGTSTHTDQYEDIVKQYTNIDNTKSKAWMKAPNGKPTKLTERQWVLVRTPLFKQKFGDWEKVAILEGLPVKTVKSENIKIIGKGSIETALRWINDNPIGTVRTVTIDGTFDIGVTPDGIQDSFSHPGKYPNKVYVLPAIKNILERGAYIGHAKDRNGAEIENYYFAAPVEIDGNRHIVFIRVRENEGRSKKFYVHEVFTEEEIKKSEAMQTSEISKKPPRGYASDIKSILHGAYDVKHLSGELDVETNEPKSADIVKYVNDLLIYRAVNKPNSTERIQKAVTRALVFFKALHRNRHSGEVS